MEFYSWSLTMEDSERGEVEILQGLITKSKLPGFLLAVSRMRDYLSGLKCYLNGKPVDHIEFNGHQATVRAQGGAP